MPSKRELAETRLQQMKRNGRTEMDIVGEGLDIYLKLAQELTKDAWPRVVNNGVVTGEFRETLLGLASLWKGQAPKAEETQSAPTLGPGGPAQDARLGNMGMDDIVTSLADVLVDGGKGCYICDWIRGSLQCSHVMGLNAPLAGFLPQTSLFRFAAAGQDFHGIALWDQSCSNIQYMARSPTTDQPREDM